MTMDTNCRAMDRDCKEIDLIRGSFLPLKNIEREREREKSNQLVYSSMISNVELQSFIYKKTSSNLIDAHGLR